jgi:YidC/Oxa1 family membrane protein insertase
MQRANLVVFVTLTAAILGLWFWLVAPTQPPKENVEVAKKEKSKDDAKAKAETKDKKDKEAEDKAAKEREAKAKADKDKADKEKADKVAAEKKKADELPLVTESLGGDGFHLTVDTTSRGAAVRKVVLNRFKAADWRGRPTDREFQLIQDDVFAPSYRMYHYLDPTDKNPVFGLGDAIWKFEGRNPADADVHEVRYSTTLPEMDIRILKTYRLAPKDYHVTLLLELDDLRTDVQKGAPRSFRYQLTGAQGLPIEGEWYTATFRNAFICMVDPGEQLSRTLEDSLRISQRKGGDSVPEAKYSRGANRLQYAGVANQYFGAMLVVDNEQPTGEGATAPDKILAWARPTLESTETRGIIFQITDDFILFTDMKAKTSRYKLLPRTREHLKALELKDGDKAVLSHYETDKGELVASWVRIGETLRPQFDDITVRVSSEVISLSPGDKVKHQFMLYHGPVKVALLAQFTGEKEVPAELVDRYAETLHLRTLTDYRSDNWLGRFSSFIGLTWVIIKFTTLMHWLLNLLHTMLVFLGIGDGFSYGVSIVILTIMVRGAMFPISRRQALFSIKMQELAPELKKLQDKYPDDAAARMQATQEFYRKHGINPLGSCWPLFLQMPIFLGLYFAFQESIHFRLAEFLWIKSLSAPDMLVYWTENIPVISTPDHASGFLGILYLGPYLNVLPVIAVVFMMIQQMQTMPPPTTDEQAMQQKMLKYMSVFFGLMFYKVAAGLCIYFISSALWGMAERKLLPKKKGIGELPGVGAGYGGGAPVPNGPLTPKGKGKWDKKDKLKDKEPVTTFEKLKAMWREILKQAEKK